jgi:hypothetical protein
MSTPPKHNFIYHFSHNTAGGLREKNGIIQSGYFVLGPILKDRRFQMQGARYIYIYIYICVCVCVCVCVCFFSLQHSDKFWDPFSFLFNWYHGLFPAIERPGIEADHSSPSRIEVKNLRTIPSLPQAQFCLSLSKNTV